MGEFVPSEQSRERLAALILNWNGSAMAVDAARSIAGQVDAVFVVDNGSRPADVEYLRAAAKRGKFMLVENGANYGYAGGNNRGIDCILAKGFEQIFIMNNDALADPTAVERLARRLRDNPGIGVAAPTVVDALTRRVLHTSCSLDEATGRTDWEDTGSALQDVDLEPRETGYVSGDAFLARADVFRRCGGFDERFFCYFEDADWSVRVQRAGWRTEVVPSAVVAHTGGGSGAVMLGKYLRARNRVMFLRRSLGMSRIRAARLTATGTAWAMFASARRGKFALALWGTGRGWLVGVVAPD